jgi:hypothetical protein
MRGRARRRRREKRGVGRFAAPLLCVYIFVLAINEIEKDVNDES